MNEVKFDQGKIKKAFPDLVHQLKVVCQNEDDIQHIINELECWVRWYPLPALWFSYIFQEITRQLKSPYHILACLLYSDAQINFENDIAISSLEVAINTISKIKNYISEKDFEKIYNHIHVKLKRYCLFYATWSKSFISSDVDPLSEQLYFYKTQVDLYQAFPDLTLNFSKCTPNRLIEIIKQCKEINLIYYRILARRFLGLLYMKNHEVNYALEQYQNGLNEAKEASLTAEIGHFHRLFGYALGISGRLQESERQFESAFLFEREFSPYSQYLEALSAMELGDARVRLAASGVDEVMNREMLKKALYTYKHGRQIFDSYLISSALLPVGRLVREQFFRTFACNALQVAKIFNKPKEILAEIEISGPRQATEIVSEVLVPHDFPYELSKLRQSRAIYYRHLNAMTKGSFKEDFKRYMASLPKEYKARKDYLKWRIYYTPKLMESLWIDKVIERILKLKIPNVVFLFFYIGQINSVIVLIDMSEIKKIVVSDLLPIRESDLETLDQNFQHKMNDPYHDPYSTTQKEALDQLLAGYEALFRPFLENIFPIFEGRNLKIFPRLQMNTVPIHAMKLANKYLLNHCKISYGQTLGLFLNIHSEYEDKGLDSLVTVYDKKGIKIYNGLISSLEEKYKGKIKILFNPTWRNFISAKDSMQASDLFFACHGNYNPQRPDESYLKFGSSNLVKFSQVFSDIDLKGQRSVIMGACESGLARTELTGQYIGMPSAFLSAGVRYVIGSLWEVNQLATAILFSHYFELLNSGKHTVPSALNIAQKQIMDITNEKILTWVKTNLPNYYSRLKPEIKKMGDKPYSHPFYWAGFYVTGDV